MAEQQPKTVEELLKEYKEIKTRLGRMKDEHESLEKLGRGILAGQQQQSKDQIEAEIFLLGKRIKIIDDAIGTLPELQRRVIERHIIDGEPYFVVCAEMYMGERGVRNLKKRAMLTLERIIPIGGGDEPMI